MGFPYREPLNPNYALLCNLYYKCFFLRKRSDFAFISARLLSFAITEHIYYANFVFIRKRCVMSFTHSDISYQINCSKLRINVKNQNVHNFLYWFWKQLRKSGLCWSIAKWHHKILEWSTFSKIFDFLGIQKAIA